VADKAIENRLSAAGLFHCEEDDPSPVHLFAPTEEEIREALDSLKVGLELVSYHEADEKDRYTCRVELNFNSPADFRLLGSVLKRSDSDSASANSFNMDWSRQDDGLYRFRRHFPKFQVALGESSTVDPESNPGPENDASANGTATIDPGHEASAAASGAPIADGNAKPSVAFIPMIKQALAGFVRMLANPPPAADGAADPLLDADSAVALTADLESLADSCGNHKIRLVATFPSAVVTANQALIEGNTATWESMINESDRTPAMVTATVSP